jgi:hypothetical protein
MIEKINPVCCELNCDTCGESDYFESFSDAVNFKKDRDNRWRAVKSVSGEWFDLCPACNRPEIIEEVKNG